MVNGVGGGRDCCGTRMDDLGKQSYSDEAGRIGYNVRVMNRTYQHKYRYIRKSTGIHSLRVFMVTTLWFTEFHSKSGGDTNAESNCMPVYKKNTEFFTLLGTKFVGFPSHESVYDSVSDQMSSHPEKFKRENF